MKRFILFIAFSVCLKLSYAAGPWNKDAKHGYVQFSFTYLYYCQLLNGDEEKIDLKRNIGDYTFLAYGEYGLSKELNVIFAIPFKMVSSASSLNQVVNDPYIEDTLASGSLSGLGNIEVGLRYNLIDKKYVLSAQVFYLARSHQYDDPTGLQIGYDAQIFRPVLALGRGWKKSYFQLEAGLSLNTSNYAQNAIGSFEYGYKFFKDKSILVFRTDIKYAYTTGHFNERNAVQTGLYRDNSVFFAPGGKLIQKLNDHFYLNIAAYGNMYSKNEGAAGTYNFGLAYEW